MKKSLILLPFLLCSCTLKENNFNDYGAFLGRNDNDVRNFENLNFLSLELDEYSKEKINDLNQENKKIFAYLNIGSLEKYRTFYGDFSKFTFLDYENWPDERWIDVSEISWQNFVINSLAKSFKEKGAYGVYLDNADVYSVCKEMKRNAEEVASGIKFIINEINKLGLKVLINGGSEFIDDMNDKNDEIFSSIFGYHQEEVFTQILDYDNNTFGKQNRSDSKFFKEIAEIMKEKGKEIFFLEYTKDEKMKKEISNFCEKKSYHYYCSETVELI